MMSSTRVATTVSPSMKTVAGWPFRMAARGTPCSFLATLSKNLELR